MARYAAAEAVYRAADRFRERCLVGEQSFLWPSAPIWTLANLETLRAAFVDHPDLGDRDFLAKWRDQLADQSDDVVRIAADLLALYFLFPHVDSFKSKTKFRGVQTVLDWRSDALALPPDSRLLLEDAFATGVGSTGTNYNTGRPYEITFYLLFAMEIKRSGADPFDATQCRRVADDVRDAMGRRVQARHILLHLLFPREFERIASEDQKQRIAKTFSQLATDSTETIDGQLQQIRASLTSRHGADFDFYDDSAVHSLWRAASDPWDEFLAWARRFYDETFDDNERDYKLEVADRLRQTREALLAGDERWGDLLKRAFGPPNNLTDWRFNDSFLKWRRAAPEAAAAALKALWDETAPVAARFDAFHLKVPKDVLRMATANASFLHMAMDPVQFPPYRKTAVERAMALTGVPVAKESPGAAYEQALRFFDRIVAEAADRGLALRDRLDAQGVAWAVMKWDSPATWSAQDQRAFRRYRGEAVVDPEETDQPPATSTQLPQSLEALADRLLLDPAWLRGIETLLNDKGQVIFYGPPGTGKTYVARELARRLAGSPERVTLVQFHPSYAYEDFVEGFRPGLQGDQVQFRLTPGPLKRLAEQARNDPEHRYVLLIDEINRGNLAKVFGELYVLLEYREEPITLQYSTEPFALPRNLLLIGTMNTADRSIALIDAALRRRFHFVRFSPTAAPIAGVLRRWLARNRAELAWVADLVDEANRRLDDDHAAIGPSHFMKADLSDAWVELIWAHSILPALAEQFFGDEARLEAFALPALRAAIRSGGAREAERHDGPDSAFDTDGAPDDHGGGALDG